MDIESIRFALSAWIAVVPTVLSLGLMSLLAFSNRTGVSIKKFNFTALCILIFIIGLGMSSVILTIIVLIGSDIIFLTREFTIFWVVFVLDWLSVIAMYIFLIWYLLIISEKVK